MNKPVETTDITVQYINAPKPGKKWGSIKSAEGHYYFAPPAMLGQYHTGEVCKIEFELGGNDGTLRSLRKKLSSAPSATPEEKPGPMTYVPRTYSEEQKAEDIFATSMAQKGVEFCGLKVDDQAALASVLRTARAAWKNSKVPFTPRVGQPPSGDDLNDEIPDFK